MYRINTFGIRTVQINDTVILTYQVMLKNTSENLAILVENQVGHYITNNNKIRCTFTSLDFADFDNKVQKLGKALKTIAVNKLNNKYGWVVSPSI